MRRILIASIVAGSLAGSLAACAGDKAAVVSSDVAAAEVALTTAERLALHYTSLPRCGGTVKVCSDPATVATIKSYDQRAYDAVKMAQRNEGTITAAWTAISAFSSAIPK